MASTTASYQNNVIAPSGGANAYAGVGMEYAFTIVFTGDNAQVTITLTDQATGYQTQIGAGNVTDVSLNYIYTFNNKVYGLAGATVYFTAEAQQTVWNDPNAAGNGLITLSNYYSTPEHAAAMAPYQGSVLIAFRRLVQIWNMDPDPTLNHLNQTLPNIGTVAPLSVQAVGDMDVYMLADNGVRSVRVRDASNNAIIADIGVPIDAIIQPLLASLTDAQKATGCGIVDPGSNRYWCYIPNPDGSAGLIYVFSYFRDANPELQVEAWGAYAPTYQAAVTAPAATYTGAPPVVTYTGLTVGARYGWTPGANELLLVNGSTSLNEQGAFVATATTAVVTGNLAGNAFTGALSQTTSFVPIKFVTYQGQVWVRSSNMIFQYGGPTNASYDNCGLTGRIPYLDCETPSTRKHYNGMEAAIEGYWNIGFSADYNDSNYKLAYANNAPSYQLGKIPVNRKGTHFSLEFTENGNNYGRLSHAVVHFAGEDSK